MHATGPGATPRVLILGAGFAGLAAARELGRAPVRVVVIDRQNHHLFQPLLYQVATASLSPADIAWPVRHLLRRQRNAEVVMGEARKIDPARRVVCVDDREYTYDYLVIATGATHSYFGRDEWASLAPGLKTVDDALAIRAGFLRAFERAELEPDAERRRALLTFVIVGAGPTGVELAGALAEIAREAIPRDFRAINTRTARVTLVEARDRVLPAYPEPLSARAKRDLERLGVEVLPATRVVGLTPGRVETDRGVIDASNILWAAGVRASPLGAIPGVDLDPVGRVRVAPDLSIPGHPSIFVAGDLALVRTPSGEVPGVAPAAAQMGRHAGRVIASEVVSAGPRAAFRYVDKGILATIGRGKAVAALPMVRLAGLPAWVLWAAVHVFFLITFRNRLLVMLGWAWEYLFFVRGARLITGATAPAPLPSAHEDPRVPGP